MKKIYLLICLLVHQCLVAETLCPIVSSSDTSLAAWRRSKNYEYSRLHVYMTFGKPFEFNYVSGWNETKQLYPKNAFYSPFVIDFVIAPKIVTQAGIGLDINLNRRIKVGFGLLPSATMEYTGGSGVTVVESGFLFFYTTYRKGIWMNQYLKSSLFNINCSYNLIPYKRLQKIGFEMSARAGVIFNKLTAKTTLGAMDFTTTQNGTYGGIDYSGQIENSKTYNETKSGIGFNASLDFSLYFGKYFSVFTQIMTGFTEDMTLSEKSVRSGSQTAYLPQQTFNVGGTGFTIGFAFHFIHKPIVMTEPVDGEHSFPW